MGKVTCLLSVLDVRIRHLFHEAPQRVGETVDELLVDGLIPSGVGRAHRDRRRVDLLLGHGLDRCSDATSLQAETIVPS